jgi:hypothetical protein
MLARSTVIMAKEVSRRSDVVLKFLEEGEGSPHEARDPLPQGVAKAIEVIGFRCFLGHYFVLGRRHDACVGFVSIRVTCDLLTICRQDVSSWLCCAFTTPVANMEGNDLACYSVHRQPKPLLVHLLLDKAPHFVRLNVQSLDDHRMWNREAA